MDNFERHIRENREGFEELKADRKKLWAGIEPKIEKKKAKRIPLWRNTKLRVAASIALIAFVGLTFLKFSTNNQQFADNSFQNQELNEINGHYDVVMQAKIQLINNNPNLTDIDKEEFLASMKYLDTEYNDLKKELEEDLNNEKVLEAIIQNYRKRIQLMERFLNRINKNKINDDEGSIII